MQNIRKRQSKQLFVHLLLIPLYFQRLPSNMTLCGVMPSDITQLYAVLKGNGTSDLLNCKLCEVKMVILLSPEVLGRKLFKISKSEEAKMNI